MARACLSSALNSPNSQMSQKSWGCWDGRNSLWAPRNERLSAWAFNKKIAQLSTADERRVFPQCYIERAHVLRSLTRSTVPLIILNKVCTHSRYNSPLHSLQQLLHAAAGVHDQVTARTNNYCMRSFTWFSVSLNVLNKEYAQLSISHALIHAHIHGKNPLSTTTNMRSFTLWTVPLQYSEQSVRTRNNLPLHSNNYCRCLCTQ
jgi:hypothetical protein